MMSLLTSRLARVRAHHCTCLAVQMVAVLVVFCTGLLAPCRADNEAQSKPAKIDWEAYNEKIQAVVKAKWHPETDYKISKDALTMLKFQINKDGRPVHISIGKPSGIKALDQQAQITLMQSKFDPLPAGAPELVDVEFAFDYKVPQKNAAAESTQVATAGETSTTDAKPLWGEKDWFRVFHYLMRFFAPVVVGFLLLVQSIMIFVFLLWLGIESLNLFFRRRWGARKTPGEQAHEHES